MEEGERRHFLVFILSIALLFTSSFWTEFSILIAVSGVAGSITADANEISVLD